MQRIATRIHLASGTNGRAGIMGATAPLENGSTLNSQVDAVVVESCCLHHLYNQDGTESSVEGWATQITSVFGNPLPVTGNNPQVSLSTVFMGCISLE